MYLKHLSNKLAEKAAISFTKIEEIYNTPLSGDEEQDMPIIDAILEFIDDDSTNMTDKIAAAKVIAPAFGEKVDNITEDFIKDMLSETASEGATMGAKWFGGRTLKDNQIVKASVLEELLSKCNKDVKKNTDRFYEKNMVVAQRILNKIEKMTKTKVRIVSKVKKSGYIFIVFSVDTILDFPSIKNRSGITITKHGSKEYHLFVGDMNVNS